MFDDDVPIKRCYNSRLIEIEKFFINTGDFRSNMRRITSLGNGKCEVTFSVSLIFLANAL